ncbi:uncharacterized protein LOC124358395 [Homalodisca vitripennis]|uniref:uncharacterized protein LOC124358395 n=1 Tax=Homalodisca vitripennis TaxID=197043 RepID=UPI001EEAA732|nr:uncharacterized protein LOC124358395 [Homalodisca vitripennis]
MSVNNVEPVHIVNTNQTYVRKFRLYGMKTTFKFNRPPVGTTELDWIKRGFEEVVDRMKYCNRCIHSNESCDSCVQRRKIFEQDPISNFMHYVMEVRKPYKDVCVIAHNGQGFDFQFVLKYVLEQTKFTPEVITRGTKVILMELDNVRFIDSLNYFPMALSALPKAFDLGPEKKKGYFPHLFNTLANQNYTGPIPAKEYYCPDSMFEKNNKDFEKWHNEQVCNNYVFDFQKELIEYCISDVDILAKACIKFRSLFISECNVDPFLEAVTIASACNLAFRRNFLKPETIGIIPKKGYRLVDTQSSAALQWLAYEEEQRGVRIQHAGREREVKIEGMKVDGFDGARIYEFQGCYYHGCPKCFPYKREEPLKEDPSDTLELRYERTKAKMEKLSRTPYELVEMWQCGFNNLKRDRDLTHLENHPVLTTLPLNPRDAFFGGRTGNAMTYHRCTEDEQIHYVDVCSLYPYVCKRGKYAISHPTIYIGDKECRERGMQAEGLLKCKVLPPKDLYHPVLPARMNDKLMFVLCNDCGEELNSGECQHSDDERALIGTWTMDEIRRAVEKSYKVVEMYELWEYKMATFEEGGLFTEFIDKFLKIKQEASGYPSWCVTDEDRERYVQDYFEHEGIRLDPVKIEKNEGLRSLAKLMLNSFWGKFGQRENQTKTLITRDPEELFRLCMDSGVIVNTIQEVSEDVVLADLVEMIPYAGENKGMKYILTIINCLTKFAIAVPLKSKAAVEVAKALEPILQKHKMKNFQTDQVYAVKPTNPKTYILQDSQGTILKGGFYEPELAKANTGNVYLIEKVLRRKKDKVCSKCTESFVIMERKSEDIQATVAAAVLKEEEEKQLEIMDLSSKLTSLEKQGEIQPKISIKELTRKSGYKILEARKVHTKFDRMAVMLVIEQDGSKTARI